MNTDNSLELSRLRDRIAELEVIAERLAEALEADRGWLAVETPASVLRQSTAVLKMWNDARDALAGEGKPTPGRTLDLSERDE